MKRSFACILICALIISLFTGCASIRIKDSRYEQGQLNVNIGEFAMNNAIAVKSNITIFDIDDVTLELLLGLYSESSSNIPPYPVSDGQKLLYGVYVYENYYENQRIESRIEGYINDDGEITDYINIGNLHLIKAKTWEEAVSEGYSFKNNYHLGIYYGGVIYNRSEDVTIPEECFSKDKGTICLAIIIFKITDENMYYILDTQRIEIKYRKVFQNTNKVYLGLDKNMFLIGN